MYKFPIILKNKRQRKNDHLILPFACHLNGSYIYLKDCCQAMLPIWGPSKDIRSYSTNSFW